MNTSELSDKLPLRSIPPHIRRQLETGIRELLEARYRKNPEATLCPSEIPRSLFGDSWRDWMDATHAVIAEWKEQGRIVVTQRGRVEHGWPPQGPYRIRLVPQGQSSRS